MRWNRRLFFVSLTWFVALFSCLLSPPGKGEIVDRIVAIVNEEIITLSELEGFRKSLYPGKPETTEWLTRKLDLFELRSQVLDALIEEKLLDQEAEKQRIQVRETELSETMEALRLERGLTQKQLEALLNAEGLTYEAYKTRVEKGLKRKKLVNRVIRSQVEVDDEALRSFYESHLSEYMADESVRLRHVLLPLPPNATEEMEVNLRSMAKEIQTRANNGEDFDTLTRQYAQRVPGVKQGDLGYFKRGEMIPDIEEIAFKLKVGEVSHGVLTPEGIVVVQVTDKALGRPRAFDEVRNEVERDYVNFEFQRRFQDWMEELEASAFIDVKL